MKYKISVIIPFYHNVQWLKEAIGSVLKQTYGNVEIILVNDGSKESLEEILEKYEGKLVYCEQQNKGAAAARNNGIKMATGDYIAFLDADDLWETNKLEIQLEEMIDHNAVWSHTYYSRFGENMTNENVNFDFEGDVFPKCLCTNPIATPCVMIKSSILKNQRYCFKEGMKSGEDSILWLLLAMNYKLLLVKKPLTKVRMRGNNSARLAYSQLRARAEGWKYIGSDYPEIKGNVDKKLKVLFCICEFEFNIINKLFSRDNKQNWREFVSKILYVLPWLMFKVLYKI